MNFYWGSHRVRAGEWRDGLLWWVWSDTVPYWNDFYRLHSREIIRLEASVRLSVWVCESCVVHHLVGTGFSWYAWLSVEAQNSRTFKMVVRLADDSFHYWLFKWPFILFPVLNTDRLIPLFLIEPNREISPAAIVFYVHYLKHYSIKAHWNSRRDYLYHTLWVSWDDRLVP